MPWHDFSLSGQSLLATRLATDERRELSELTRHYWQQIVQRDHSQKIAGLVHHRRPAHPTGTEGLYGLRRTEIGLDGERIGRHHIAHRETEEVRVEPQLAPDDVTVGEDTDRP